jgi:hypothetical protein
MPSRLLAQVSAPGDFTIVALPDTQNEAQFFPATLNAELQWIVDHASDQNIQMVLGEGDIVNNTSDIIELQNADASFRLLDNAGVPYLLAIGNHDYEGANPKGSRTVTTFNQWFGPLRYAGRPYYGANFPSGSNENFYGTLTIGGQPYLFLLLEFRPRSTSLDWAEQQLTANAGKRAIIVTHSFLIGNGTREDICDSQDMPLPANANGEAMWARLRRHPNVSMVLSGHFTGIKASHRSDLGDSGNLVHQIFTNYQDVANGGDGWMRLLTFSPATNSIIVRTYSPFLDQFKTGPEDQYVLSMSAVQSGATSGSIKGKVRDASTCAAVAGATVAASGATTTTAADGTYTLNVPTGPVSATVTRTGYNTVVSSETVAPAFSTQLNVYMSAGSSTPPPPPPGPCTASTVSPSVTICSPTGTAPLTSPVQVSAVTRDTRAVSFVQAYVDGVAKVTQTGATLNASLAMATGTHRLPVQARDSAGVVFKQTVNITVGQTSPPPPPGGGGCTSSSTLPFVSLCTPSNGATVSSPVTINATAKSSHTVSFIQAYVDGVAKATQTGATLNTSLPMSAGTHRLTVQAKDSSGAVFKTTINITVAP